MALLDFILDNTGAIGNRIKNVRLRAEADRQYTKSLMPLPQHASIVTFDGKVLVFDVTTDLNIAFPTKVTSYPVEDRSTISDHVVNNNPTITISGIFSDASFPDTREHKYNQSETYDLLQGMRDKRDVVQLIAPFKSLDKYTLRNYNNLILTNITIGQSTGQGDALYVDLSFEQIRKVINKLDKVTIGTSKNKTAVTAGDTAVKNTPPVDVATKPKNDIPISIRKPDVPVATETKVLSGSVYPLLKAGAGIMNIPTDNLDSLTK